MTALLTSHFEERVSVLKAAVDTVIKEKSEAKIALVEKMVHADASDEELQAAVNRLDSEYLTKQIDAERHSTEALEPVHTKNQMRLRQQQLEEIARIVGLYTDPSSLSRLQQLNGKSQEDELREYREKLERDRTTREESLQKERTEAEAKMREKLQEEMEKVQKELAEDKRRSEEEFERKRLEIERQRDEFDKKAKDESGKLHHLEKAKILEDFEKEQQAALQALDQDRKNKKANLADRLARRRSTVNQNQQQQQQLLQLQLQAQAQAMRPSISKSSISTIQEDVEPEVLTKSNELKRANSKRILRQSSSKKLINDAVASAIPQVAASVKLIESKLERIEKVMQALEQSNLNRLNLVASQQKPMVAKPVKSAVPKEKIKPTPIPAYQDINEPEPGNTTEIIPESDVQMQEKARLEFGKRIAVLMGLKSITIKAAYSLPPATTSNNAFANSYLYMPQEDTLLVHNNRLSSSGDFGLVVIHALSHIKVRRTNFFSLICSFHSVI
jgi:hypothetical protein